MISNLEVLFVEDDNDIREILSEYLSFRVKKLFLASDGEEGLESFKLNQPDIVITDISMPKMDGLEMAQEIKAISPSTPIILQTAHNETSYLKKAINIGIDKYISKPIEIKILLEYLNYYDNLLSDKKTLNEQSNLLKQYKDTIDKSAIVSKTNEKGIITFVNEKFCEISGYKEKELLGKNHNIVRHPDIPADIFLDLWQTIRDEKKPWIGEIKNKKKDGGYYWVHTIVNPILDQMGNIIEYIAIRYDITNEMRMKEYFQDQLSISNKQFSSALNLSKEYERAINESTIVSRTDLSGKITYVNEKFIKVSGFTRKEILGNSHNIVRNKDTPNSVFKVLWESIKNGQTWKGTLKNKTKNGKTFWVDTTIVPIKDEKGNLVEYMAIRNDVTELFDLHKEIEDTQREIIYKMGEIGETRSKETGNHVKRVAHYSKELAKLYGLSKEDCDILFTASPMHDIGKVGIPDKILKKPGKLSDEEFEIMKDHSIIGKRILSGSNRAVLKAAKIIAYEHHEKWDGSGYPRGIKKQKIHIFGRITAVADVFDALGSERYYKKAWEDEKIFKLFKEQKGKHFDPELVDIFFDNLDTFLNIREKFKD